MRCSTFWQNLVEEAVTLWETSDKIFVMKVSRGTEEDEDKGKRQKACQQATALSN